MSLFANSVRSQTKRAINPIVSQAVTVPAPIGGINVLDSLAAMPPTDAIGLKNWLPQPYGCAFRGGRRLFAHSAPSSLKTIYGHPVSGFLYVIGGGELFEISVDDDISALTPKLTLLTTDIWHFTPFANSAGNFMVGVSDNGANDPIVIDETGTITRLVEAVIPGSPAVGEIDGIDPASFTHVTVHQRRLWFSVLGSSVGYYLPPDALSGVEARPFDFGPVFTRRGGELFALGTWSADPGQGADDLLVLVSSSGDIAVYQGTDPNTASTWRITGTFFTGSLASRRCIRKVGGDLLLLTGEGLITMSSLMTTGRVVGLSAERMEPALEKVRAYLRGAVKDAPLSTFWHVFYLPDEDLIIVNAPPLGPQGVMPESVNTQRSVAGIPSVTRDNPTLGDPDGTYQLVLNTVVSGWGEFNALGANHWASLNSEGYFCTNNSIFKYGVVPFDMGDLPGDDIQPIEASVIQAFSNMGVSGRQKYIGLIRPTFVVDSPITFSIAVLTDYNLESLERKVFIPSQFSALWNSALWNQAVWAGSTGLTQEWISIGAIGQTAAVLLKVSSVDNVTWVSTDWAYQVGSVM